MRLSHLNLLTIGLVISFLFGANFDSYAHQTSALKDSIPSHYKVSKIDSSGTEIQRLFLVIDSADVHNFDLIQSIIIDVCQTYHLNQNARLSFFSDEKYADYKDILFKSDNSGLPIESYKNWLNNYYLAEFDFDTSEYLSYPANSIGLVKSRAKIIKNQCVGN